MQGKAAPSPDIPVVMVGRVGRRRAIAHMNLAAAKAGLRLGQAVAHATAMVPGLVLHDLDAAGDDANFAAVDQPQQSSRADAQPARRLNLSNEFRLGHRFRPRCV